MQTSKVSIGSEAVLSSVATWWRNWRSRRRALDELEFCGDAEMAHIAHDVGVPPAELRILAAKWPDSSDLLSRRLESAGLEEKQIEATEPQALRDLERVCSQCDEQGRCQRDFNRDESGRGWRDYCPNVATLDALRSEERDRRFMRRSRKWRSF
jgi:hypothetical protein